MNGAAPTEDDLAGRLGLPAGDPRYAICIATAESMVCKRVDPLKVLAHPDCYREGVLQLAVKVWDTGSRGLGQMYGADGDYLGNVQQATAGMWRSVAGVLQPVLKRGGITVG